MKAVKPAPGERAGIEIFRREFQLFGELGDDSRRQIRVVLQAHGVAHAPLAHALFDGAEQIFVASARN